MLDHTQTLLTRLDTNMVHVLDALRAIKQEHDELERRVDGHAQAQAHNNALAQLDPSMSMRGAAIVPLTHRPGAVVVAATGTGGALIGFLLRHLYSFLGA
jgi:hypothetical protein